MIEVKLPSGAKDLRIKHFKSLPLVPEEGFTTGQDSLLFLCEFLNLPYNTVLRFTPQDIKKMTVLAVKALSKMDVVSPLPKVITIEKQRFTLVDPKKIGIGWHIDFSKANINTDPVRLACLFYVQEGYNYSDVDENGNILFPIASRYELFKEHFPLDLFIRSSNFFLKGSLNSTRKQVFQQMIQNKTAKRTSMLLKTLTTLNGKRLSKK